MAKIIGGVTSSHIPAVGNAIANELTQEPYWKRFFDGYEPAKAWLRKHQPDVAIVVYNDHGLNFFLDKVPTFALGCADTYYNDDEGWALKPVAPFKGNAPFSWHIAENAGRAGVRHLHVPGDEGRPRLREPDPRALRNARRVADHDHSAGGQHGPAPGADRGTLLQTRAGAAHGHRVLRRGSEGRGVRHRGALTPAAGRARGPDRRRFRPASAWIASQATRSG